MKANDSTQQRVKLSAQREKNRNKKITTKAKI